MARWLAIAVADTGDVAAAVVNDATGENLPFGDHGGILSQMKGVSELTALVELPEDPAFRPDVIDTLQDAEAPLSFIDL